MLPSSKGSIEGFINNKDQLFNIYITANLLILNSIDNEGKQHNELDRHCQNITQHLI